MTLTEEDHNEADKDHLDEEFEKPEILFEQDHFIDQEVGENDDGDIDNAVCDQHGSEQGLWFFEQRYDPLPGDVLFGLEDIDVLKGQGEKGDFGTGEDKRQDK